MTNSEKIAMLVAHGLSRSRIAWRCHVTAYHIRAIERGERKGGKLVTQRLDELLYEAQKQPE